MVRDYAWGVLAWVVAPIASIAIAYFAVSGLASLLGGLSPLLAVSALLACAYWFWNAGKDEGFIVRAFGIIFSLASVCAAAWIGGVL